MSNAKARYTTVNQSTENNKRETIKRDDKENQAAVMIGVPLKNELGDNNSFLNVMIQTIYNIEDLNSFFLESEFESVTRLNIFAEFKIAMERYRDVMAPDSKIGERFKTIDTLELRQEIALLFKEEKKFQVNEIDDVSELFFAILNAMHSYVLKSKSLKYIYEKPCHPTCLSHKEFRLNIIEQPECSCGAKGEITQFNFNYYFYEIQAKDFIRHIRNKNLSLIKGCLMENLKEINSITDQQCPNLKEKCPENKVSKKHVILNLPKYMIFNISWKEIQPKLEDICKFYLTIPSSFQVEKLFDQQNALSYKMYEITGLICYADSHYICLFKKISSDGVYWISYNDTIIFKLAKFKDVIIQCLKMRFHPVMLIYTFAAGGESYFDSAGISAADEEKILSFCHTFDNNNENTYKRNELTISRLRPSMEFRAKPDPLLEKFINKKPKFTTEEDDEEDEFEHIEDYGVYVDPDTKVKKKKKTADDKKVTKKEEKKDDKNQNLHTSQPQSALEIEETKGGILSSDSLAIKDPQKSIAFQRKSQEHIDLEKQIDLAEIPDPEIKISKHEMPFISDEDWACSKCRNINRISESLCVKCKQVNLELFDSNLHQKYIQKDPYYLFNSHHMPSGRVNTSISMNSTEKNEKQNKREELNEMYASEIRKREREDEVYCICENCTKTNFFTRLKCEFCNNNIKKRQEESKSKATLSKDKDDLRRTAVINLDNTVDDDEKHEKQTSWICLKCDRLNQRKFEYCEFCYTNNPNQVQKGSKKNQLTKIDKNSLTLSYWDKINIYNEQKNKLSASQANPLNTKAFHLQPTNMSVNISHLDSQGSQRSLHTSHQNIKPAMRQPSARSKKTDVIKEVSEEILDTKTTKKKQESAEVTKQGKSTKEIVENALITKGTFVGTRLSIQDLNLSIKMRQKKMFT